VTQLNLDSALVLAAHGRPVFPLHYPVRQGGELACSCRRACEAPAKHPFGAFAHHGVKNATTDPKQIAEWWSAEPRLNIALAATGLLILDVDPRHGGPASLAELELTNDLLPRTWTVRTGSDGRHIYMALPAGTKISNSAGRLGRGLDVRTTGGYVVGPGSLHISGESYRWLSAPDEAPLAQAPAWLLDRLKPAPPRQRARSYSTSKIDIRAVAGILRTIESAHEGNRNEATFWAACRAGEMIRAGWFTREAAFDVLLEAALKTGLPEHAALATIRSGLRTTGI
jgi:Bifunctional DNA primase/polymerase, N-terminal